MSGESLQIVWHRHVVAAACAYIRTTATVDPVVARYALAALPQPLLCPLLFPHCLGPRCLHHLALAFALGPFGDLAEARLLAPALLLLAAVPFVLRLPKPLQRFGLLPLQLLQESLCLSSATASAIACALALSAAQI